MSGLLAAAMAISLIAVPVDAETDEVSAEESYAEEIAQDVQDAEEAFAEEATSEVCTNEVAEETTPEETEDLESDTDWSGTSNDEYLQEGNLLYYIIGNCDEYGDYREAIIVDFASDEDRKAATELVIPESIDGIPVIGIEGYAFRNCPNLTSVTIPEGVGWISYGAFQQCPNLVEVNIPSSVYSVGNDVFLDTPWWANQGDFVVMNGVLIAYQGTGETVEIPDTVTQIHSSVFAYHTEITTVIIPNSVIDIYYGAFCDCSNLTTVIGGDAVAYLGEDVFQNTPWLENQSGFVILGTCLIRYLGSDSDVVVPDEIETICSYAFAYASNVVSVEIPYTVTNIQWYAIGFRYDADSYEYLPVDGFVIRGYEDSAAQNYVQWMQDVGYDFTFKSIGVAPYIPDESLYQREGDFLYSIGYQCSEDGIEEPVAFLAGLASDVNRESVTELVIPETINGMTVVEIEYRAFQGYPNLTSVTIPETVTWIGEDAFRYCPNLETVTIPETINWIGSGAFQDSAWWDNQGDFVIINGSLLGYQGTGETVKIPDTVTEIRSGVFADHTEIETVIIPDTVYYIYSSTFQNCTNLTSVTIPSSMRDIYEYAFENCTSLTQVDLSSVRYIGSGAFYGCASLTQVDLSSVWYIGSGAFYGCTSLAEITLDKNISNIGEDAFADTLWLAAQGDFVIVNGRLIAYQGTGETVEIPNTVTEIGEGVFAEHTEITSVIIPDSVHVICASAFERCTGLTSVTIPNSVTEIYRYAFRYCTNLTQVNLSDTCMHIGWSAFAYTGLTEITIPQSMETIEGYAFYDTKLTQVTLPENCAVEVDDRAFGYINEDSNWDDSQQVEGFVITGYPGSGAQRYAEGNGFEFVAIHNWDNGTITTAATCTDSGVLTYTCTLCGEVKTESIPANDNHTVVIDKAVTPTSTRVGKTEGSHCSVCGEILVAQKDVYKISYVLSKGTNDSSNPTTYVAGEKTITLSDPTRTGYTFSGWYNEAGKKVTKITKSTTGNQKLTAQWTANQYTIKFNANDGTGTMSSMTGCDYGTKYTLAANSFTRKGYTFAGWNTKADGSGTSYDDQAQVKNLRKTTGSVTLYAQWTPITYTVKFKANGGSGTMSSLTGCNYGTKYTLTANGFTRKGYTFAGWNTKADGSGTSYKNKASVKNLRKTSGSVTLYAQWTPNTYTVKFNANGGTGTMSALTGKAYGTSFNLTANAYKRTGYTFTGWNTKKDGSGTSYTNKASVKNLTTTNGGTVTLYAQWKKN